MTIITLLLRTQQPILATSRQGDPNSDVSYPYIPGSLLRGVLINRYLKSKQLRDLDINDVEVRRLFFDGTTRYLNGYLFKNKQRCLPVPRCLVKNKGSEPKEKKPINVYDLAQIEQEDWEDIKTNVTPKPLSDGFCTIRDNIITLYNVNRRINIHHLRNRKVGRATEEYGEVFRYDAIDAGQTFQAIILCDDNDAQLIHDLLRSSESLWLGGSRSAGYGYATIDFNQIKTNNSWDGEVGISPHDRCERSKLIITLLSDTIMRNKSGQCIPDPQLVVEAIAPNSKLSKAYATTTTCGGFNRKWGLPLPLVPALAAGSVFVLDDVTLSVEEIQALEVRGIGERRVDGFGQIAINWLEEDYQFQAQLPLAPNVDDTLTLTDSYSQQLAKMMAERLLRQKLDTKLQDKIPKINLQSQKYISNSQLSRLAIVAREALNDVTTGKINNDDYISPILRLLDSDNLTNQARHQFDDTKIIIGNNNKSKSFKQQILEWLDENNPGNWITNLDELNKIKVAGITQPLTRELNLEYTILLIMAVVKKLSEVKGNDSLS